MATITIPVNKVEFLRQHSTLIDTLADITPGEDLVLPREDFPVLTDTQWTVLQNLVREINVANAPSLQALAQQLNSILVVSRYAERNNLSMTAIYDIAVAMYEFIGGEDGNLDQLEEIFYMGEHINNLGVLSNRLGMVTGEDFKEMGDYLGFHGGKRKRKTRKAKKH